MRRDKTSKRFTRAWSIMLAAGIAGAVAFVWIGLALAWGGAAVKWARGLGDWTVWEALGAVLALLWAEACAAGVECAGRRWSDRVYIATATGLALAAGLGWAWFTRGMGRWPMDSGFFRWFLDRLAEGGYTVENLRGLTEHYDYGAWCTRAWPVYLPLRWWTGPEAFAPAVQALQAVLAAACVPLAWRVAWLLRGRRAARWTVAAMVGMPGFAMQCIGLNHQVLGACEFLAATWLLAEWMFGGGTAWKKAALAAGMCVLAAAARFEGSAWSLFLLGATVLLALECVRPGERRLTAGVALVAMVLVPAQIGRMVTDKMLAPAAEANPESINGGSLAFMARGWDFEWGGEYSDAMQTLDVLTPRADKERVFKAYLAGQCAYNGPALVTRLFPSKLAKFLLPGYASLAEEILWANGAERTARLARGARTGWFVLFCAPLALWGLWRLVRHAGHPRTAWLVIPVALTGVAVMLVGETSPRYSMPVQALLFAAAACGLTFRTGKSGDAVPVEDGAPVFPRPFAVGLGVVLVAYFSFAAGLLALRGTVRSSALADMRAASLESGHPRDNPRLAPFEAVFPDGTGSVVWPGRGGRATAYLRGATWRDRGTAEVECPPGTWREVVLPARLEFDWEDTAPRRVALRRIPSGAPLLLGHVAIQP